MMVTTQLSGVSNPFSLRLANEVVFGMVLFFYFVVCLVEIEQKEVRALRGFESYLLFIIERCSVTGRELAPVQVKVALDQLNPGVPPWAQRIADFSLGSEPANEQINVLVDLDGFVAAVGRASERQRVRRRVCE